jgi:cytochrome c oxidase subunit 3
MPTTLTKSEKAVPVNDQGGPGNWDDLKRLGGGGNDGPLEPERMPPPEGYPLTIRLVLVSVTILFITLTVVYVWLKAQEGEFITPRLFWVSTFVVLLCSLSLEMTRRQLRQRREPAFQLWLWITMAVGLTFLALQYVGLQQLITAGFFVRRSLRTWLAFFIVGVHAAHLIGGILALIYLITKSRYGDWTALRRKLSLDATILYWHFIDLLWIFLFVMLFLWN